MDQLGIVDLVRPFLYIPDTSQRRGEKLQALVLYYLLQLKALKKVTGLTKFLQTFRVAVANIADGEITLKKEAAKKTYRAPTASMQQSSPGSKNQPIHLSDDDNEGEIREDAEDLEPGSRKRSPEEPSIRGRKLKRIHGAFSITLTITRS
jgi:hypothetical protein